MKPSSSTYKDLFTASATLQRMLDFEAALARAEAVTGVIPKKASSPIVLCCKADRYDPEEIAEAAQNAGNTAIPLIKLLTEEVKAIDANAARYVHWGATSQDVIDTALILQLREAFELADRHLAALCGTLAQLADLHRATAIAARTWMQQALPSTLGLKFADWMDALHRQRVRMTDARARVLALQFGGAGGSLAALGDKGLEVSAALSAELKLPLPDLAWHTERDRVAEAATLFGMLMGILGKMARDLSLMMQSEVAEVAEPSAPGRGGSSTLPHKRNPVTCAAVLAAAMRVPGLVGTMLSAMVQEHERALGGWQAEWETLPQIICLTGGALEQMMNLMPSLEINQSRMLANLEATRGLIYSESVSMLFAARLGKSAAHELVEKASQQALRDNKYLKEILLEDTTVLAHFANSDIAKLFDPLSYLGMANEFITRTIKTVKE